MRLIHFSDKVCHRRRGQKRVSHCVALEMGHRAGVVPGIEANPMWVLKSKSTQIRVFSSFPQMKMKFLHYSGTDGGSFSRR